MQCIPSLAAVLLATAMFPGTLSAQLTPQAAAAAMARGINLGNTLEPPTEGAWNNGPAQEVYFDDFAAAGFAAVRVPVRWDKHTGTTPPYAVAESWMNRVEQVLDWGLSRGLYVIVNGHHEDWLKTSYANEASRARYDSIWAQVSRRFWDKPDRLLFEIMNEPFGMTRTQVDELNARILGIIRRTNPTRIVIIAGNEYSGVSQLVAAAVPNDPYLVGTFHSYDPWSFAGEGRGTWGTDADRNSLRSLFATAAGWSSTKRIPVTISEFGVVKSADYNSRMALFAAYVDEALLRGIPFQVWDDGGNFGLYQRSTRRWDEVVDILIHARPDGPTRIAATAKGDSAVVVSWSRRGAYDRVRIERKTSTGTYETIGFAAGDAANHTDRDVSGGRTYTYRVVAEKADTPDRPSYPHRISVQSVQVEQLPGAPDLSIYPVPADDELIVEGLSGPADAEFFDMAGRRMLSARLEWPVARIPTSRLAAGPYLLRVVGRDGVPRSRVVAIR